jgi:ABC-type transport system involved in multi-copper enzyme maturation permease subunit
MIWHIFRKDLRLLWPVAALVAATQLLNAGLLIAGGQFLRSSMGQMSEFGWVSNVALPGIALLGLVVLVMAVIQQDRLPGTTQDWLTRPIPRSQLLLAKLLFVVLSGLLPILAADLAMGLAEHLNAADVVAASLTRSVVLLFLVCVPAALIGAVTRTLTEALVLVVAVAVLLIIEFITLAQIRLSLPVMMQSGYGWIDAPILILLNLGALIILLPLQLRWRSGNRVRWILAAYFCLLPAVVFLPWDAAIQIDRVLESRNFVSPVGITLDMSRRMTFMPMSSYPPPGGKPRSVLLRIPVVASNVGTGNQIYVDRIKWHSIDLERGGTAGPGSEDLSNVIQLGYLLDRSLDSGKPAPEIVLTIPFDAFEAARTAQSRIEIQLLATKLRLTAEKPLQSLESGSIDDHGRCYPQDGIRFGRSSRTIYCVSARPIGDCFGIKDPSRQPHNAGINAFRCGNSTYAPWPLPLWRDAYYAVSLGAADDWQPQISSPTASETPKKSELIVTNYVHDVHLVRTIDFQIGLAVERAGRVNQTADGVGSAARFASPTGVVADSRGNLFIVDEADSVIRKVTPAGEVSTFAGLAQRTGRNDGAARDARFTSPHGIAIDKADNLFVADSGNGLIRKITPAGIVSTLMGGTGDAGNRVQPLRFKNPRGVICSPDGTLYVIDLNGVPSGNFVIRKVSTDGVVSTIAGPDEPVSSPDDGGPFDGAVVPATPAQERLERD